MKNKKENIKNKKRIIMIKSKALKDFEKELPKIYKGIKPVRTKSKLGTTNPIKSVSRIKSKWGSTTTTSFIPEYPMYPFPKTSFLEKLWNNLWRWVR